MSSGNLKSMLRAGFKEIERCGSKDSYLVRDFLGSKQADELMSSVDASITYLDRADPRMRFRIYGKSVGLPRDKAVYGDVRIDEEKKERVEPFYKYAKDTPPVEDWKGSCLQSMSEEIAKASGQVCNHVVVNQYRTGEDYIGEHHDKSKSFEPGSSVLTISLGAERILRLRKVKGKHVGKVKDFVLNHGSLFVLGPKTNAKWKHSIVRRKNVTGRRVSLTYRSIAGRRTSPLKIE